MNAKPRPCPACQTPRSSSRHYLCARCWFALPLPARTALLRRDLKAADRLIELTRQLSDGVPVTEIRITIR